MPWKYFKDGRPPEWHTHPVGTPRKRKPHPPGPLARMVSREGWKAARRAVSEHDEVIYTDWPLHTVRFTYTDTWRCDNPEECTRLVWELQENHMAKYTYDIKWNFLIAPDGTVYEGRGWDFDAERPMKYYKLKGKCIDIAYMGNYIARPVPKPMLEAAEDLISWGVQNGMILCCHDRIPHTDPQIDDKIPEPAFNIKFYNEYDKIKDEEEVNTYKEIEFD